MTPQCYDCSIKTDAPILPAIITVLIGNFLIGLLFKPALERLSQIREELLSVALPLDDVHMWSFRVKQWNAEKLREEEDTARRSVNEIFRKYSPEQLGNLNYLVSNLSNIHPESLIRLLNIGVQRITWEKRSQLILSCGFI